jgi:hypothetical protein
MESTTNEKLQWLALRAAYWTVAGCAVQHVAAMALSYASFEHGLFYLGHRAPAWWPGNPESFWSAPLIQQVFERPALQDRLTSAYLGPGIQPGVLVPTEWGAMGVWRISQDRRLCESWGLLVPAFLVTNEDDPPGPAPGWISLDLFEDGLQRIRADSDEDNVNFVFRGTRYESLYELLERGDDFTLTTPSWVQLPPHPAGEKHWDGPSRLYFSAAWGAPFKCVQEHAVYARTSLGELRDSADFERSDAYWTLLEYDGLPRSTLGPTFSSGIAWRPIWSGAALNAPLVGAILWGTTKLVSVAVVAPHRRRRARKNGVCRTCGYRLAGASTPLPICPECGTRIV